VDAVRSRIKRDTIAHVREGGRVYVLLGTDQSRPGHGQYTDQGARPASLDERTDELIATLREQLEAERRAHAEARRIIAGLVERIPALEAPESPETAAEEGDSAEPQPTTAEAQEGVHRPWWRRVFGG